MIGIMNYGLGNIKAFSNIYKSLDIQHKIVSNTNELKNVTKIILPGVGAFDYAMKEFNSSGLKNTIETMVLKEKIPILGVCVGMQMLANTSDEGVEEGLGWIDAKVKLFKQSNVKLPQMGWNTTTLKTNEPLFKDIDNKGRFYFLHSYYFECKSNFQSIAETSYGIKYTSAVKSDNIHGVQFHPEKSHKNGVQLLYNFSNL